MEEQAHYTTTTRVPVTVKKYLKERDISLAAAIRNIPQWHTSHWTLKEAITKIQEQQYEITKIRERTNALEAENLRLKQILRGNTE